MQQKKSDGANHNKDAKSFWKTLFKIDKLLSFSLSAIASQKRVVPFSSPDLGSVFYLAVESATSVCGTFYSDTFFLVATNADKSIEHKAFCKVIPADPSLKENAMESGVYERENTIYNILFPQLMHVLEKARMDIKPLNKMPILYHSDETHSFLLLEDLKSQGFRLAKRLSSSGDFDFHHLSLALNAIAEYHAITIAYLHSIKNNKDTFDTPIELRFITSKVKSNLETDIFKTIIKNILPLYLNYFKHHGQREIAEWLGKTYKELFEITFHRNDVTERDPLLCILHGDFWTENVMYRYEADSLEPTEIKIIDWQLTKLGHPGRDIAYFIYNCSSGKTRRDNLKELLDQYFSVLMASLQTLGINLERDICTRKRFLEDMKRYFLWAMFMAFMMLPGMEPNFGPRFNEWKNFENEPSENLYQMAVNMVEENHELRQRLLEIVLEVKEMNEN